MSKLTVSIVTVGCRANQSDAAWLGRALHSLGFEVVGQGRRADVYVVNSCAVTAAAERDVRRAVHGARRLGGDDAKVLLTGCMVTAAAEHVAALGSLWKIVPSVERHRIPEMIASSITDNVEQAPRRSFDSTSVSVDPLPAALRRTRPNLRVQDGCEQRCSYCAVPAGRGPQRSMAPSEVLERLHALADEGAREVVICGINLAAWGSDLVPRKRLADLIDLLDRDAPVERVRLSSIEPWAIDEDAIDRIASSSRLAPHLHLPLQSGDDDVLLRMRRPYSARWYRDLAERLLSVRPDLALGTDVIAGFPGESAEAFERTRALVDALPLAFLHVFGFSPRSGTVAAGMEGRVAMATMRRRVALLRELGDRKRAAFARTMIGNVVHPLFEARRQRDAKLRGVTGRFLVVLADCPERVVNRIAPVLVQSATSDGRLVGRLLDVD